jgi:[acyl-carrier-protein] S-malonyltransferase
MAEADALLGFPLSTLCFEGPAEVLTDTINAQPALLAASVATLRAAAEAMPELPVPVAVAGHSMGEYSALVAAGALSYADGLRLVRERGRLMKEAGAASPGGMAAVLGLDVAQVAEICAAARAESGGVVQVANDNCPGQVVISGDIGSLELAMARASAAGAAKVVRLAVSIAAHSPLMAPAASALSQAVQATEIRAPETPVISNITARPFDSVDEIRAELAAQLTAPVRWSESMGTLVGLGVDTVVELGPGDVLSALMKRIDRGVKRLAVGDPAGIAALKESLQL